MSDIALVTGRHMPHPDSETPLLLSALETLGIQATVESWGTGTDWTRVPLVVLRTPWDYSSQHDEFLAWCRDVARHARMVNPPDVVAWNIHKGYLLQLQAEGVPTVPSVLVRQHATAAERAAALSRFDGDVVIKPAVSVGAIGTSRLGATTPAAAAHLDQLTSDGDALVQPLVELVTSLGESSLVFLGGEFSHAVRKIPAHGDFRVQQAYGGTVVEHQPSAGERRVAAAALDSSPARATYARVDLVQLATGPALMELELIEPELFLRIDPASAGRYAAVLAAELDAARQGWLR